MESLTYTVQIEPAEEGGFVASVPALPGCFTQGETVEQTIAMAREAIEGYLAVLTSHGQPIHSKSRLCIPLPSASQLRLQLEHDAAANA